MSGVGNKQIHLKYLNNFKISSKIQYEDENRKMRKIQYTATIDFDFENNTIFVSRQLVSEQTLKEKSSEIEKGSSGNRNLYDSEIPGSSSSCW